MAIDLTSIVKKQVVPWNQWHKHKEDLLRKCLSNYEISFKYPEEFFSLFRETEISNILEIIKVLEKPCHDVILCENSNLKNLKPLIEEFKEYRILINFLEKEKIRFKGHEVLSGKNIVAYLINTNLFSNCGINKFLEIDKLMRTYFKKQNNEFVHFYVLLNLFQTVLNESKIEEDFGEVLETLNDLCVYQKILDDFFAVLFILCSHLKDKFKIDYKKHKSFTTTKCICKVSEINKILEILQKDLNIKINFSLRSQNPETIHILTDYKNNIDELLCKLNFLLNLRTPKIFSSSENLTILIKDNNKMAGRYSSDEDICKQTENTRRKSRLKKRPSCESDKFFKNSIKSQCPVPLVLCDNTTISKYILVFGTIEHTKSLIENFAIESLRLKEESLLSEKMNIFVNNLNSIFKSLTYGNAEVSEDQSMVQRIKNVAAIGYEVSSAINLIEKFVDLIHILTLQDVDYDLQLKKLKSANLFYLDQYESKNRKLICVIDLILNLNLENEMLNNILHVLNRTGCFLPKVNNTIGYLPFLKSVAESMRIIKLNKYYTQKAIPAFSQTYLISNYTFKVKILQVEMNNYDTFRSIINKVNISLRNIKKFVSLYENSNTNFFFKLFTFLQHANNFIKLSNQELKNDVSLVLEIAPHDIIQKILLNRDISLFQLEIYLLKINLNLGHVLTEILYPDLTRYSRLLKNNESLLEDKKVCNSILKFISHKSTYLAQLMHQMNISNYSDSELKVDYLRKYLNLDSIFYLSCLQGKKIFSTGLFLNVFTKDLNFNKDFLLSIKVCRKLSENRNQNFNEMQNIFAKNLIKSNIENMTLFELIADINKKSLIFLKYFEYIEDYNLLRKISNCLIFDKNIKNLKTSIFDKIKIIHAEISIYYQISRIHNIQSWKEAKEYSKSHPENVFEQLISKNKFTLLRQWGESNGLYKAKENYPNKLLKEDHSNDDLNILKNFPANFVYSFIQNNFYKLDVSDTLYDIVKIFGEEYGNNFENRYTSLMILILMKQDNLQVKWNMINKPLLLIEQLIMNSKFQLLSKIVKNIEKFSIEKQCKYCSKEDGKIYSNFSDQSAYYNTYNNSNNRVFILLNFNLHKTDHILTSSCVDLLLRVYASKALDFQISKKFSISYKSILFANDGVSIDSLATNFKKPEVAPKKNEWIKDEATTVCQSCYYTVFTMFIRRHHCRRCGRVVCYSCSKHRIKIPELYQDVQVRICNDCVKNIKFEENRNQHDVNRIENIEEYKFCEQLFKWEFNGNLIHDKMLREQFCYDHACDVALCLTILSYHKNKEKCINLLLYHCKKLERLLALKNPEVNFDCIANILSCLSLAAKIRGGPCEAIRENADTIKSFSVNGCEDLMIPDSFNRNNIKKLIYNLVCAEKWSLALDVSFKRGISKSDVLSAHGLAYLKSGCFESAREKFMYCMGTVCSATEVSFISGLIFSFGPKNIDGFVNCVNRPKRSPPLLAEILRVIESTSNAYLPEDVITKQSMQISTISISSRHLSTANNNISVNQTAFIILNTLSSLKTISNKVNVNRHYKGVKYPKPRIFNESLYFLLSYGSHFDIIAFLIRYKKIRAALRYFILQKLKIEYFIPYIFIHFLKLGDISILVGEMLQLDEYLKYWNNIFTCLCRYLENKRFYNVLYQLQILLRDPVRASMTCVRFYLKSGDTFTQLTKNNFHLDNALKHLENEIELNQNWEHINLEKNTNENGEKSFPMQLDYKSLNAHLNTIVLQKEVSRYLAGYEENHSSTFKKILQFEDQSKLPSLFGSVLEKFELSVLVVLCANNLKEGFGLSSRIIKEYKLNSIDILVKISKYLAENNRIDEIPNLCECIRGNVKYEEVEKQIDAVILETIKSYTKQPGYNQKYIKKIINWVKNIESQILCYILIDQLETAYLLAVQYKRLNQLNEVLRVARIKKRTDIIKLCEKILENTNI